MISHLTALLAFFLDAFLFARLSIYGGNMSYHGIIKVWKVLYNLHVCPFPLVTSVQE